MQKVIIILFLNFFACKELLYPVHNDFNFCTDNNVNCNQIKDTLIPMNVDLCTIDLPVFIMDSDNIKKRVFLKKFLTLLNDSEEVECKNKANCFNLKNYVIKRFNNHVP